MSASEPCALTTYRREAARRRRRAPHSPILAPICLCLLAAACALPTPAPAPGAPAPVTPSVYVAASDGLLRAYRVADGTERWSVDLGSGNPAPAVAAAGVVYVAGETGKVKSGPAGVTAVRASDGKLLWRAVFGGLYASPPLVAGDTLFVGANDGYVYALRAGDGHVLWKLQATQALVASPVLALAGGTLYVGAASSAADGAAALYALRPADGSVRWRFAPAESAGSAVLVPVPAGGAIYLATQGRLYAVRPADGGVAWSVATGDDVAAFAATAGAVYLGTGSSFSCAADGTPVAPSATLSALRPADGSVLWTYRAPGLMSLAGASTPAAVYADLETGSATCPPPGKGASPFTPTADALYALGSGSGSVMWHYEVAPPSEFGGVQVTDGRLYAATFPSGQGVATVYAFDAASGAPLWHRDFPALDALPFVAGGAVYVDAGASGLYALRPSDGSIVWNAESVASFVFPPAVDGA